jgi:hypothetical protein
MREQVGQRGCRFQCTITNTRLHAAQCINTISTHPLAVGLGAQQPSRHDPQHDPLLAPAAACRHSAADTQHSCHSMHAAPEQAVSTKIAAEDVPAQNRFGISVAVQKGNHPYKQVRLPTQMHPQQRAPRQRVPTGPSRCTPCNLRVRPNPAYMPSCDEPSDMLQDH